jgi:hypothetical protein
MVEETPLVLFCGVDLEKLVHGPGFRRKLLHSVQTPTSGQTSMMVVDGKLQIGRKIFWWI